MPNSPVPVAAPGLPSTSHSLLTPSGRYDRAAILRAAHAEARATLAGHVRMGIKPWPYALALRHALKAVWSDARTHMQCAQQAARYAAMDTCERAVADLEAARWQARMIDSTPAYLAECAAIDAQLTALHAAA